MKRQVKAVPVRVEVGDGGYWQWVAELAGKCVRENLLSYEEHWSANSARRNAREFWAQYGCKVRFVK